MTQPNTPPAPENHDRASLVDLHDLLAAPLIGLVAADFQAARHSSEIVETFGFTDGEQDALQLDRHLGRPRTVSFVHPGPMGPHLTEIPVLSMLPLPFLQIAEADLEMSLRLIGPRPWGPESGADAHVPGRWAAMLTPQNGRDRTAVPLHHRSNLTMKLRVREADLPAGIANLLQILGQSCCSDPCPARPDETAAGRGEAP